jgi:hypothetical protein
MSPVQVYNGCAGLYLCLGSQLLTDVDALLKVSAQLQSETIKAETQPPWQASSVATEPGLLASRQARGKEQSTRHCT